MRYLVVIVAGALLAGTVQAQSFDFQRYSIPEYRGARVAPDFSGPNKRFSTFRTSIRDGFMHGPLVAGHYALIRVGCGMECLTYYFGDVRDGAIAVFPIGGEYYPSLTLVTAPDSRLIVANWGDPLGNQCTERQYILIGDRFSQVGSDVHVARNCGRL